MSLSFQPVECDPRKVGSNQSLDRKTDPDHRDAVSRAGDDLGAGFEAEVEAVAVCDDPKVFTSAAANPLKPPVTSQ